MQNTKFAAVMAIILVPLMLMTHWVIGSVGYWRGFAEGEASVVCAPNDGNLPDLLECYSDREILQQREEFGTTYEATIYDESERVLDERAKCRQWYADRLIAEEGGPGVAVYHEYLMKFTNLCKKKHPMPEGIADPW